MPEPGGAPGLSDIARRWAAEIADAAGDAAPRAELERFVLSAVTEAADAAARHCRGTHDAAVERFAALYTAAPCGVALAGPDGTILDANPALLDMFDTDLDTLAGHALTDLGTDERDVAALRTALADLAEDGRPRRREQVQLGCGADGAVLTNVTVTALAGTDDEDLHPVLLAENINELHLLRETLRRQNIHDQLTGLPNAGSFLTTLETWLGGAGEGRIAVVYLDIDGFRVVNDGLGPGAADTVLRYAAGKLESVFAGPDTVVARLAGDGFAVLVRGEDVTAADVIALVEEAMAELGEPVYVGEVGVSVSISAGIVVQDAGAGSTEEIQRAAEITLHRAKEAGRAQWMLYEPDLDAGDRRRYGIGAGIGGGMENGEFAVDYEPTVKLDGSNEIAVVNAVLRWDHPRHGKLDGAEFLPLADATGMTPSLGTQLLSQSMGDAAAWYGAFPSAPDLCVRLPTRLAVDPNLVRIIRRLLEETGLPAQKLRICTDSLALFDPRGEVLDTLSVLADLDVKITLAISGASDLELVHTHKLPVGFAILSGPLVDGLAAEGTEADNARAHLYALLERSRELGIKRMGADGVRNAAHARRLRDVGIFAGRGKHYGGTATGEEIRTVLEQRYSHA
ncbi:diguanylate cyclase domain-containing protein [Prauserella rugosa]|uniref:Diguanylate cyclase (GGDEF)-like protein n=1 Tax=Prauserella rugosa TaxID=43354 RepID=A0A660C7J9_9PSEU|nr:diguanylate cyclase [Prauserella rugosa]KID30345.1 diguanylate cyclase (GGDEF) domain-containing protein [Prauserella sp. Am3]TWH19498.1 diguanylate cyclase (GGDEF)-like protein [Prauserella rugosa]